MFASLLRLLFLVEALRDGWDALKALFRRGRTTVSSRRVPKRITLPKGNWANRFWAAFIAALSLAEVTDFFVGLISKGSGLGFLAFAKIAPDHAADVVAWAANQIVSFEPLAAKLAGETMSQIIGADVTPRPPNRGATAEERRGEIIDLGGQFANTLSAMFSLPEAAQDFTTRTGYNGSINNMLSYFGTNLTFQMRSLTIGTVASLTGWHTLRHLENLHQSVNWAFGFGWLSWSVMSKIMDVAVSPGVARYYNSQIKPHDLSASEAIDAWIRGWLSPEEMQKVLDNEGIMTLARDPKFNMNYRWWSLAESIDLHLRGYTDHDHYLVDLQHQAVHPGQKELLLDLNESMLPDNDVLDFFQRGVLDENDVYGHFRKRGYRDERARLETRTIVEARTWDLLDKITESYGRLYRDAVIDENEYRQFLGSINFTAEETDLRIAWEELERQQRTFLSNADLGDAVDIGLYTPADMYESLTSRGYTPEDAAIVMVLQEVKHLPACDKEKIKKDALIAFLQGIGAQAGVNPALLKPQVLRYLQCLDETVPLILPIAELRATPDNITGSGVVTLEWNTEFATSARLDPEIGPVSLAGKTEVVVSRSRSYTLTASNPLGKSTAFAFINVKESA